jgi:two-component system cell cycle sensor histidine kinase/response regulator CckA
MLNRNFHHCRLPAATVLLVHGDEDLVRRMEACLTLAGLTCVTAATGEAALAWLSRNVPDLMLITPQLPDMTSQELIVRQQSTGLRVPFIILTDHDDPRSRFEMRGRGALDCLVKDAHWLELLPWRLGRVLNRLDLQKQLLRAGAVLRSSAQRLWPARQLTLVEEALRESETRFHTLADLVPDLLWMGDPQGLVEWCNQRWSEYTGQSLVEAKGSGWISVIHDADVARTRSAWGYTIQVGEPLRLECRIHGADGHYRWFLVQARPMHDAGGRIVQWFTTATDIDDLKRVEAELQRREERFRSLIENASDLITVINAGGVIHFQSPSAERLLGHQLTDLLGRSVFEFVHPDDVTRVGEWIQRAQSAPVPIEFRIRHRNGVWLVLQSVSRTMPADDGKSLLVVNSRDVTSQKQLEAQLRQAQKLEAIGRLAGGVAHDFNNLLSVIFGHSALLARAPSLDDPQRGSLAEIRRAAERAASLTRQLLAFSRQQLLEPKVLDLNVVVTEAENLLRRLIGEDVRLATVLQPGLRPVRVDPSQIDQVILNLAVNARDAMPRGGTLTLETRDVELEATDARARPGPHVLLRISDTGSGMTPEVQARIFDPFFTTKGEGNGTGLGLAVVHGIVEQSGGYIDVGSVPGVGTTFKIYLPTAEGAPEKPTEAVARKPVNGMETILLAEDEEAVRQITSRILAVFGYRVLEASSGEEAMRLADTSRDKIHLLLTDVVMPGMSGRELADALRARDPDLKVLFQSGYTDDAVVRHGVVQAEVAFLHKPFTPDALAQKIREVLDRP